MSLIKLLAFGDTDTTGDAEDVLAAMMKETEVSQYLFLGDGPYSKTGTKFTSMMGKYFDDAKKKLLMISRGNHDEDESESKQTQKDIESWFPEVKGIGFEDTWLSAKQVGNVYIINMDTQDLDIEFKRDQYNWVASELQKAKQLRTEGKIDWIIVLFHKPSFTLKSSHSPYTAMRFLYKDIFADAQVDFALSGHNHNTQLWLPMIPNESEANGEGEQLFTLAADNKTFDFAKLHGILYIVNGISGHEFNSINDSGSGVKNVMFYRDDAFGYTSLEFDGKKAKVLSKTVDGKVDFEYNVTREGDTTNPPPDPEPCPEGQHRDENGNCVDDPVIPPDPTEPKCPKNYEFDPSLNHCIPLIEPDQTPDCGEGYTWNPTKKICEKDNGGPDPEPGNPIAKLELPTKAEPKQVDVIADASQSIADDVQITETTNEGIQLIDTGEKWKKKFNIPDKNNFSIGIQAIAKKGTKTAITQKSIQVSTTGPPPEGEVLWDSNVHLKTGQAYKITDTYGSQEPDGKGVFMAASGSPRLIVDADGTFHLEADSGHGRVYIKARNYNARMEGELMFEDNAIRNTTLRLRSRHNMGGDCENRFGGFGVTVEREEQLAETSTERCHNEHSNTVKKPLEKDIEVGKWLKFKYSCWSSADKKSINQKLEYDYNDGQGFKTVLDESFDSVEPHMMDEASFNEESYAWLRVNNESTGSVAYKNIRILKI